MFQGTQLKFMQKYLLRRPLYRIELRIKYIVREKTQTFLTFFFFHKV